MKNKIVAFCISILVVFSIFGLIYLTTTYPLTAGMVVVCLCIFFLIVVLYTLALGFLEGN